MSHVSIDGNLTPLAAGRVSVVDRGFLYGDSAFEVIRTYLGQPFRLRPHVERLERSCKTLGIPFPVSVEHLIGEVKEALEADGHAEAKVEKYIRVVISRGAGPLRYDPTTATDPTRVIIVAPLNEVPAAQYANGSTAVCLRVSRVVDDRWGAGTKASNYLPNLLAGEEAKRLGAEETLVTGFHGEVLEGTTSNVFVVKGGAIRTTPLATGILSGITRAAVLETLDTMAVSWSESMLFPRDVYQADEVFITSTIRELISLTKVDGNTIGSGKPGPLAQEIHGALKERIRSEMESTDPFA